FANKFEGKKVYICYDSDKAGRKGAEKVSKALLRQPEIEVYIIDLDLSEGEDVTDFFMKYKKRSKEFLQLMDEAKRVERTEPPTLPMKDIGAEHLNKEFVVEARIMGDSTIHKYIWNHYNIMRGKACGHSACKESPLNG